MGTRILSAALLVAAVALLVVALTRDGDNVRIAFGAVLCGFGAAAAGSATRKRRT